MKIDKELFIKIVNYYKKRWQPLSLLILIVISLLVTILLPSGNKKPQTPVTNIRNGRISSAANNKNETKKSLNLFDLLFNSKKTNNQNNQTQNAKPPTSVQNVVNAQTSTSTVTKVMANGTKVVQKVDGSTIISTVQGTINPNVNTSSSLSQSASVDNIRIVFQNADGSTFTYIPPGTPPDEVRWAIYTNHNDHYSLLYPFNWQFVYSISNGHEGVALYPPNTDPSNSQSPRIGFGMTDNFLLPVIGDAQGTLLTPIVVDNLKGGLYTNGPIGNSFIASVIPYSGKFFGLGASKSDVTFSYVYYFMINSVNFNVQ